MEHIDGIMTEEQIKKGLECCSANSNVNCDDCPYNELRAYHCCNTLMQDALKLIQQHKPNVVKCKDCVSWEDATLNSKGQMICPKSRMDITPNAFCSWGVLRDEVVLH